MAAPCPLLGDGIADDTLLNIARFLPSARDLVCLQLTNKRFAAKVIAAGPRIGARGEAAAAPAMLSILATTSTRATKEAGQILHPSSLVRKRTRFSG